MKDTIARNLETVNRRIAAACQRAARPVHDVTLVAVTKTLGADTVRLVCELGLRDIGENRVQEAHEKIVALHDLPLRWHMIGHLQGNKAALAADLFQMVQSVDSAELAERLNRRALAGGRRLPVLLEVNIGEEPAKFGFGDDLIAAAESIVSLTGLDVQGLMTVAPMVAEPEQARVYFRRLRLLRDQLRTICPQLALPHLSMGMTDDFETAIEEGATIIRLGRALFGPRR